MIFCRVKLNLLRLTMSKLLPPFFYSLTLQPPQPPRIAPPTPFFPFPTNISNNHAPLPFPTQSRHRHRRTINPRRSRLRQTRVITEKILHLISQGVKPDNILALTFSDKAAHEMLERLENQINTSDLTISTFHAFSVLQDNVLDSGLSFSAGIISRANQLVWGLEHINCTANPVGI